MGLLPSASFNQPNQRHYIFCANEKSFNGTALKSLEYLYFSNFIRSSISNKNFSISNIVSHVLYSEKQFILGESHFILGVALFSEKGIFYSSAFLRASRDSQTLHMLLFTIYIQYIYNMLRAYIHIHFFIMKMKSLMLYLSYRLCSLRSRLQGEVDYFIIV